MINIEKEACLFRGMPLFRLFVKKGTEQEYCSVRERRYMKKFVVS